ncbi:hypothetical protein H0H92_010324, partial [Tricholoma furcatifolium]
LIAARAKGVKGYLEGTTARPETPKTAEDDTKPPQTSQTATPVSHKDPTEWSSPHPSIDEWDIRDAWTLALIIYNCKNPVSLGINMAGTAAEAWKSLTETYGVPSELAAMGAENLLRSTHFADDRDFHTHIQDLRTKWEAASEKGAVISDATFCTIIIMVSLPEVMEPCGGQSLHEILIEL